MSRVVGSTSFHQRTLNNLLLSLVIHTTKVSVVEQTSSGFLLLRHRSSQISKYHFNFCCQHHITYFISCPVEHRKATCTIGFASVAWPCLSQRPTCLSTDIFNYGQISDPAAVDAAHKEWRVCVCACGSNVL